MAQTPEVRLGGLVLGTDDPQRLATWYKAAFAPDAESGEVRGRTVVELGAGRLVFDRRDDLGSAAVEPTRILINLLVDDIRAVESRLKPLDAEWIRPVESVPPTGFIATLKDPDGNYVQLLQRSSPAAG